MVGSRLRLRTRSIFALSSGSASFKTSCSPINESVLLRISKFFLVFLFTQFKTVRPIGLNVISLLR